MIDYSYRGKETQEFEKILANYTGVKYVVCTNTGTAALHLSYLTSGINKDDEVLVPALTFVGTVNPLSYIGATPHFYDLDIDKLRRYLEKIVDKSGRYSYNKLTGNKISAIVAVHLLGYPCNMDAMKELADDYNLILIEDACQALGSFYKGVHVGNFGVCGTLSFNGNKIITTGGGGALLTNDESIYKKALHLSMVAKDYSIPQTTHNAIGFNYRMPAYNAALGIQEFKELPNRLKKNKNKILKYFPNYLSIVNKYSSPNYWKIPIKSFELGIVDKKENVQPYWSLISESVMYRHCPKMDLSLSKKVVQNERFF